MDSTVETVLARHHAAMLADWGDTLVFSGASVPCAPVSLTASQLQAMRTEVRREYRLSLAVSTTTVIAPGQKVTWSGTVWRVLDRDESPDGREYRLHCGPEFGNG